jgi:hypothetical protein
MSEAERWLRQGNFTNGFNVFVGTLRISLFDDHQSFSSLSDQHLQPKHSLLSFERLFNFLFV